MSTLVRASNSRIFDNFYNDAFRHLLTWEPLARSQKISSFSPQFDVVEKEDGYYISADVPGLSEEEIEVTVHDATLTVAGTRAAVEKQEGDTYFVYERSSGDFKRRFSLPENADADSISASLKNGVLQLTVGKRPEAKPRRIALK